VFKICSIVQTLLVSKELKHRGSSPKFAAALHVVVFLMWVHAPTYAMSSYTISDLRNFKD